MNTLIGISLSVGVFVLYLLIGWRYMLRGLPAEWDLVRKMDEYYSPMIRPDIRMYMVTYTTMWLFIAITHGFKNVLDKTADKHDPRILRNTIKEQENKIKELEQWHKEWINNHEQ